MSRGHAELLQLLLLLLLLLLTKRELLRLQLRHGRMLAIKATTGAAAHAAVDAQASTIVETEQLRLVVHADVDAVARAEASELVQGRRVVVVRRVDRPALDGPVEPGRGEAVQRLLWLHVNAAVRRKVVELVVEELGGVVRWAATEVRQTRREALRRAWEVLSLKHARSTAELVLLDATDISPVPSRRRPVVHVQSPLLLR